VSATVTPLRQEAAYTPLDKPGRCQTPGHEDQEARSYPGGRLCDPCITASRRSYGNRNDNGE
jgi:hypothetical protein